MRSLLTLAICLLLPCLASAQGTPPMDSEQLTGPQQSVEGTPPLAPEPGTLKQIKKEVKKELERAVMGRTYPTQEEWTPLTPGQKFQVFVHHTYAPRTFAAAAVNSIADKIEGDDPHYERGALGLAQHYGVELASSESD